MHAISSYRGNIDYLQAPIENWAFYSLFYVEDILSFVNNCTVVW